MYKEQSKEQPIETEYVVRCLEISLRVREASNRVQSKADWKRWLIKHLLWA